MPGVMPQSTESLFGANQLSGKNTTKKFKIFAVNMNYSLSHVVNT
jgi:hypothetical protein